MKILISETQYKTLIVESSKEKIISTTQENFQSFLSILKTAQEQLKDSFRFLITYEAGIGTLVGPVTQYLQGEFPTLNREQIIFIYNAVSIVFLKNRI